MGYPTRSNIVATPCPPPTHIVTKPSSWSRKPISSISFTVIIAPVAPTGVRWHAPRLGEHNAEIFGDLLGMQPSEIAALHDEGVSGYAPAM